MFLKLIKQKVTGSCFKEKGRMMPRGRATLDRDPSSQVLVEQNFIFDTGSSKYLLGLLELNGLIHLNMISLKIPMELV